MLLWKKNLMRHFFVPFDSCLVNSHYFDSSINFEVADVCSLFDGYQIMEVNDWKPHFEELLEREIKSLPSSVEVPKLELKEFPCRLKYAFFVPSDTFPIAITLN